MSDGLLLLSGGKPHDLDVHNSRYVIKCSQMAVIEQRGRRMVLQSAMRLVGLSS